MRLPKLYAYSKPTETRFKMRWTTPASRAISFLLVGLLSFVPQWFGDAKVAAAREQALPQLKAADQDLTIDQRIARIRAEVRRNMKTHRSEGEKLYRLAQWYNWPNWPNHWNNWGNWPNHWYNY